MTDGEQRRGTIGAFFLAGDSWWEAGICGAEAGPYAGFLEKIEGDVAAIRGELEKEYRVVSSGLIHTTEDAVREARLFNEEAVEAVVFCPLIWTNDPPVVAFLQEAVKVPLLMWAYDPYPQRPDYWTLPVWLRASGPVSVQQSSNILRRFGWDFGAVFGHEGESEAMSELKTFIRAATTLRGLKGTRIAVIPSPCRVVVSTWVDDFFLLEKFGVELRYVSVDELLRFSNEVTQPEIDEYVHYLKSSFPNVGVDDEMLDESARQALGLVGLTRELALSGIALEDFNQDFYRTLGFRPHLYHPDIGALGCTIGFEADVLNVLSTIIVGRLAGHIAMFNEFFTIDRSDNTLLMGHPGHGEIRVGEESSIVVTPDLEFDSTQKRGAWISYRARAGEMTFLNFTPEYGRLKISAFRGDSLPGPRVMEGYSHMVVRAHPKVDDLFRRIVEDGLIQHWGTVHGNILPELRTFARLAGLGLTVYE